MIEGVRRGQNREARVFTRVRLRLRPRPRAAERDPEADNDPSKHGARAHGATLLSSRVVVKKRDGSRPPVSPHDDLTDRVAVLEAPSAPDDDERVSMAGQRLGDRYRVVRSIARGGMGAVLEGIDERDQSPVAIKLLLDELAQDPTCRERFRREASLVASLSHPSLVAVRAVSLESTPSFLVMELIEGRSLARVLAEQGQIPWRRLAQLACDVLGALAVVHDAGVVHRDLKPANVMVVREGTSERAKLIDLGVAQLTTGAAYRRLTATGAVVGTPAFMSPEQLAGEPVGPASDLWSMGVLLHTCLTGERPFAKEDLGELLADIAGADPPRIETLAPDVPRAVANVVRSLLRKRAEERPASARRVADQLRDLLEAPALPLSRAVGDSVSFASVAGLSDQRPRPSTPRPQPAYDERETGAAPLEETPRSGSVVRTPAAPRPARAEAATPSDRTTRLWHVAGAGAVGALLATVAATALAATCIVGMLIAWGAEGSRPWLPGGGAPPTSAPGSGTPVAPLPTPGLTPLTIEAHRLDVLVDGPDGQYTDANAYLHTELPRCLPLHGRSLGVVLHYVVWLTALGAVERIERHTEVLTSTEQACVENAIRAARWPAPESQRPIVNVSVNALY